MTLIFLGGWVNDSHLSLSLCARKVEENVTVGMRCWTLWVDGWGGEIEGEKCKAGRWVGGWDVLCLLQTSLEGKGGWSCPT